MGIIFSGTVAALITIPAMVSFAWLFDPIIFVRVAKLLVRTFFCWPFWLCKSAKVSPEPEPEPEPIEEKASAEELRATLKDARRVAMLSAQLARKPEPEPEPQKPKNVKLLRAARAVKAVQTIAEDHPTRILPPDWKAAFDERTARPYYYHDPSGRVQWQPPPMSRMLDYTSSKTLLAPVSLDWPSKAKEIARISAASEMPFNDFANTVRDFKPPAEPVVTDAPGTELPTSEAEIPTSEGGAESSEVYTMGSANLPTSEHAEEAPTPPPSPPEHASSSQISPQGAHARVDPSGTRVGRRRARGAPKPVVRTFSYESLNENLLKASLTQSWKRRDWPTVKKILLGWCSSVFVFFLMVIVFLLYGCELFEESDDADAPPAGNTDELIIAWVLSAFQRFVLHEPTLILASKGLPILFASAFCQNVCGETIVNLLNTLSVVIMEVVKSIKTG